MEIITPTKIKVNELKRQIVIRKREDNLVSVKTSTFWIKDIRSFDIVNHIAGVEIRIKSRGNHIVCKGFSVNDAQKIKEFLKKLY